MPVNLFFTNHPYKSVIRFIRNPGHYALPITTDLPYGRNGLFLSRPFAINDIKKIIFKFKF